MTAVLTTKELNRALLARQLLLERARCPVEAVVRHLVGLQAQSPDAPYYGLWSRLEGFTPDQLADLIATRRVVRATMMRGTIHAVTTADCLAFRSLAQPVLDRQVRANYAYDGERVAGVALPELLDAARELLTQRPRTASQLRRELAARWPDRDPESLGYAARTLLPVVHVPPRGMWAAGGLPRLAPVQDWLGRPVDDEPDAGALVRRYLAAFGPATVADVTTWSGLTAIRDVLERLRPELEVFTDERGRELFDLPAAPRPPADTPAPVRFVAPYDNVVLGHADRSRIVPEQYRRELMTKNGIVPGTVLVDGFVRGTWEVARRRGEPARLTVRLFGPLPEPDAARLRREAAALRAFAAIDRGPEPEVVVQGAEPNDAR